MLSTCQDSGPGVTALVQILFLGHCIQVQKSVFLALYRARKITLSFSFPQTMWKLILVHLRGRKHFCIWVEKCFPPLRCTPKSVFHMVWGKKECKVIFLALYNARKTTFCTWVWCLLSKWWVRKNIFPISYILKKVLRCRKIFYRQSQLSQGDRQHQQQWQEYAFHVTKSYFCDPCRLLKNFRPS